MAERKLLSQAEGLAMIHPVLRRMIHGVVSTAIETKKEDALVVFLEFQSTDAIRQVIESLKEEDDKKRATVPGFQIQVNSLCLFYESTAQAMTTLEFSQSVTNANVLESALKVCVYGKQMLFSLRMVTANN